MSFFKDFKEDLSQAVNELVSDEGKNEITDDKEVKSDSVDETDGDTATADESTDDTQDDVDIQLLNELFSNEDTDSSEEEDETEDDIADEDIIEQEDEPEVVDDIADDVKEVEEDMEETKRLDEEKEKEATKEALRGNRAPVESSGLAELNRNEAPADEVTEITKGTSIEGNIICEGSMNVYGKIKGNVASRGKLVVSGTIVGASRASEIYTNNAKIDGDVTSDGSIKIGNGSIIIGNVYGTSAVIAGAVKGDIDVHGPVVIDGTAVVQGNIRSRSVQINNGAAIEGSVSQCYAEIDYAALFDKTFSE